MTVEQFLSWFILLAVVVMYGISYYRRNYPVGHPWSGVCLLLLGYDSLLKAYNLEISSPVLRASLHAFTTILAGLWIYTAVKVLFKKPTE